MAVTNTWTNPTALDRNTGQTIREQDWDGVLSDLMVLGGTTGSSGVNKYNLLTNGGFEIWQRGNGPFTAASAYFADRWLWGPAGSDTMSISRDSANAANAGSAYCAACTFTLGTGGGGTLVNQRFAAGDGLDGLKFRTVTFSILVKTSLANAVRPFISPDGHATTTYGSFHTGSGAYETLTVTLALGAATDVRVGVKFGASGTHYLDNAMLVVGSVPADYAPLHPADDLARCLRYYEVLGGKGGNWPQGLCPYADTGGRPFGGNIPYKAVKAVAPTVTKNGTWQVNNCGQPTSGGADTDGVFLQASTTAAGFAQFYSNAAGQSITVESNP